MGLVKIYMGMRMCDMGVMVVMVSSVTLLWPGM
jgi:hypothetical protein